VILGEEILSAATKERRSGGDLLGMIPMPPGSYLRRFSPLSYLVSEGDIHNKEYG
jgi:hypothetical protein